MPTSKKSHYPLDPLGKNPAEPGSKTSPRDMYAAAGVQYQAVSLPQDLWGGSRGCGQQRVARPCLSWRLSVPHVPVRDFSGSLCSSASPPSPRHGCCVLFNFPSLNVTHSRFHLDLLPRSRFINVTDSCSGITHLKAMSPSAQRLLWSRKRWGSLGFGCFLHLFLIHCKTRNSRVFHSC